MSLGVRSDQRAPAKYLISVSPGLTRMRSVSSDVEAVGSSITNCQETGVDRLRKMRRGLNIVKIRRGTEIDKLDAAPGKQKRKCGDE